MAFVIRKLNVSRTLGEEIRELRRATGFTLSELEERTKVRKSFLDAFERDDFSALPETLYARNYLRIYLRALGASDPNYFMTRWEEARGTCDFTGTALMPRQRVRRGAFIVASRFLKVAGVAAILLAVTAYIGTEVRAITSAPPLLVYGPEDGAATRNATVTVRGETDPGTNLKVNGQKVLLNSNGSFETDVSLERGVNVIKVEGAKRYSRSATMYRRVVLEADKSTAMGPGGTERIP